MSRRKKSSPKYVLPCSTNALGNGSPPQHSGKSNPGKSALKESFVSFWQQNIWDYEVLLRGKDKLKETDILKSLRIIFGRTVTLQEFPNQDILIKELWEQEDPAQNLRNAMKNRAKISPNTFSEIVFKALGRHPDEHEFENPEALVSEFYDRRKQKLGMT